MRKSRLLSYPVVVVLSRRDVLKYAAAAPVAAGLGSGLAGVVSAALAPATASAAPLGTLLDYAAGVIPAAAIRASGASGAIRYVSDRRPGGDWMLGKPIQLPEARDLYQSRLKIVSCYQFGKQDSADWLGGQKAGVDHAKRGWQLHLAAGGSYGAPIYASIDDDPTPDQYERQVAPYLRGWEAVLGHQRVASTPTPRRSTGRCKTGLVPTSGNTAGVPRRATSIRRHTCIRSRSTGGAWAASGST